MATLILQATPLVAMVAPKLQTVYSRFLEAFDAYAEAKMRAAVPIRPVHESQREFNCLAPTDANSGLPAKQSRPDIGLAA